MLGFHATPLTDTRICHVHGEYTSKCFLREIWTDCPKCSSEAKVAEEMAQSKADTEKRRIAWEKRLDGAGIPERFQSRTLANYRVTGDEQRKALAFAAEYASEWKAVRKTGRCALFLGRPGTGKTHLAIGIGQSVMEKHGASVLFTSVSRIMRRIKDSYRKGSAESEQEAIAVFSGCDLLILDELGIQFGTEYEKNTLFDVINERYENLRPTIILSNLALDEARAYLGERTFRRLKENGGQLIVFTWEGYQGEAA